MQTQIIFARHDLAWQCMHMCLNWDCKILEFCPFLQFFAILEKYNAQSRKMLKVRIWTSMNITEKMLQVIAYVILVNNQYLWSHRKYSFDVAIRLYKYKNGKYDACLFDPWRGRGVVLHLCVLLFFHWKQIRWPKTNNHKT